MTVQTELARLSALDMSKTAETFSATKESLGSISGGLSSILGTDDRIAGAVNTACGALQIMTGLATVGKLAKAVTETRTAVKTAEAGALTALNSTNPIGWSKIVLASATAASVSAVMYATVSTVRLGKFDLSTSSGQTAAVRRATEAMA